MTWSYSGDPTSTELDKLRFLCGDTDTTDQLISNEEVNYLLSTGGSATGAAPLACVIIMAKLAREVDYAIGPEKVNASQRLANYKQVMEELRAMWTGASAVPSWTGSTSPDVPSLFDIGMHDNGSGGDSAGSST